MHSLKDYDDIKAQLKKRSYIYAFVALIGILLVVVSFIKRIQLVSIGLTIVFGGIMLFMYSFYIYPIRAYKKHLWRVLYGRKRSTKGYINSFDTQIVEREGVEYHALTINTDEGNGEADDRLFYYTSHKMPFPYKLGDYVEIVAQGRAVADIKSIKI